MEDLGSIIIYLISIAISLLLMYVVVRFGVRDGINASKLVEQNKDKKKGK